MSDGEKTPSQKKLEELLKMMALENSIPDQKAKKDMNDYKFWKTQPVAKFDEQIETEGPIDKAKTPSDIPNEPYPMLKDFEWVTINIDEKDEMTQVYELLKEHYVEDKDATFRFKYTPEFFEWSLKPPGYHKDWYVGVRVKSTGKLVAFISAIPASLSVRSKDIKAVEINFLCIHKKLRSKRLAPVLIKEITRRVNKCDIWQALYTGGVILPSPVTVCRYTHRPLDWNTLYDVGFSTLPQNVTKAQMVAKYQLPNTTKTEGLRKMKLADVDQTYDLFNKYNNKFKLIQTFSKEEFSHWILGAKSIREQEDYKDEDRVVLSYVVEDKNGKITDFFSFYILPFSVLDNAQHDTLGVAYLFYYASEAGLDKPRDDEEGTKELAKRLKSLIADALILAKRVKVDVFNALTSQDNCLFLDDLKFGAGDGYLNFYLFNYKAFPVKGGIDSETDNYDLVNRSDVGVVML
ncbi:unnamed protein product [[Candida] boidinii]|uniref:Glycylpeptide N-tetradecanoyltransferase n=1 Tax=Candida boidinii TaxID=5477 RepID=A0A9W6WGE5_CANBO|nr:hypothetical protein BVG19_g4167 [[Candida] boidinii]OWB53320.1 hypothetical protein B5S27_g4914 [[Candida] boidinii]OWB68533.1 hypothetical protein B5S30_g3916 [[Candida] boidinii]OWB85160.1 hypothetical protein B5S33_g3818 [[Candida] boidinii]GME68220.1 unnamed protein product [[Candida] boidinii]